MQSEFRPTSVVEVQTEYARRLKARRAEYSLFGPIRIADIQAAAKLGGACLALLLALHYRRAYTAQDAVTLPSGFLAEFGIDKSAKQRALKALGRGEAHQRQALAWSFGSRSAHRAQEEKGRLKAG